jgi:hypothetical protein
MLQNLCGNKRGRTKNNNTKFLQDLMGSPNNEKDLIGGDVDLDLLSIFTQVGTRIMEGLGRREAQEGQ